MVEFAFLHTWSMWCFQLRLLVIVSPRYLALLVTCKRWLWILQFPRMVFFRVMRMTLHWWRLNAINQFFAIIGGYLGPVLDCQSSDTGGSRLQGDGFWTSLEQVGSWYIQVIARDLAHTPAVLQSLLVLILKLLLPWQHDEFFWLGIVLSSTKLGNVILQYFSQQMVWYFVKCLEESRNNINLDTVV